MICTFLASAYGLLLEYLKLPVYIRITKTNSSLSPIGLTTAFNLLRQPQTSVTLVEKAFDVALGASRKNGFLLCPSLDYPWTSKSQIVDVNDIQ